MNERMLCRIWQAQRFDRRLFGTQGEAIEVVYRGRSQAGPGPDFPEAMIVVDGELRCGDVEVHVRASDWWSHGHHRDPHYSRVILHVVLEDDRGDRACTVARSETTTLALGDHVGLPGVEVDSTRPSEAECHAASLGSPSLEVLLDRLGDERFLQKAAQYEANLSIAEPEEVLYRGIMETLGYSRNRVGFRELARRLPAANLFSIAHRRPLAERVCLHQAMLFGVSGLLPSQRQDQIKLDWLGDDYAEELEHVWEACGYGGAFELMEAGSWTLGGVRPPNHPARRVGAAGHLLAPHLEVGLVDVVSRTLLESTGGQFMSMARLFVVEDRESYWATYYDFGRSLGQRSARLIGTERSREMALNAALPFALAYSSYGGDEQLGNAAWSAFRSAPRLAENEVTRQMTGEVLGSGRRPLIRDARRQQALIHLHHTWCDRRVCLACPLGTAA